MAERTINGEEKNSHLSGCRKRKRMSIEEISNEDEQIKPKNTNRTSDNVNDDNHIHDKYKDLIKIIADNSTLSDTKIKLTIGNGDQWYTYKSCNCYDGNQNFTKEKKIDKKFTIYPDGDIKEANLPRLPVPNLKSTLKKYLEGVKPVLNNEQYNHIKELVNDFESTKSEGIHLQNLLEKKASTCRNWLEKWWLSSAYLEYRASNTINVSPAVVLPEMTFTSDDHWLRNASLMVVGILDYKRLIDRREIPTQYQGNKPLCMEQYYKVFSSCRIPGWKRDGYSVYSSSSPHKHICIVHRNQFYAIDVYTKSGEVIPVNHVYAQLRTIVQHSSEKSMSVGMLTSYNRDSWYEAYQELLKENMTKTSIETIQKSLFLLCLDDALPSENGVDRFSRRAQNILYGCGSSFNAGNRWADKFLQVILSRDGCAGMVYEHTLAEAPVVTYIADHMMNYISKNPHVEFTETKLKFPHVLPFRMNERDLKEIKMVAKEIDNLGEDLDVVFFKFDAFGKEFIKSRNMSPDAFIQISLQLAYFSMHKKNTATYESGSLRAFQGGRTEVIRSCSTQSANYCSAVISGKSSCSECAKLLRSAVDSHSIYTKQVMNGNGVDRHLMGLKLIALENGIKLPALFEDPLYAAGSYWRIASSQISSRCDSLSGYGPVVEDGYGISYNPLPEAINVSITSWCSHPDTNSQQMKQHIIKAFKMAEKLLRD